jgi:hypothetical protein
MIVFISNFHNFVVLFSFFNQVFLLYTFFALGCALWFLMNFDCLEKKKKIIIDIFHKFNIY